MNLLWEKHNAEHREDCKENKITLARESLTIEVDIKYIHKTMIEW